MTIFCEIDGGEFSKFLAGTVPDHGVLEPFGLPRLRRIETLSRRTTAVVEEDILTHLLDRHGIPIVLGVDLAVGESNGSDVGEGWEGSFRNLLGLSRNKLPKLSTRLVEG